MTVVDFQQDEVTKLPHTFDMRQDIMKLLKQSGMQFVCNGPSIT